MSAASTSGDTRNTHRKRRPTRKSSTCCSTASSTTSKFRTLLSLVSRSKSVPEDDWIDDVLHETIIFRWSAACLNVSCPIFSKNPPFNMIFCPIPSLVMFAVLYFSSENAASRHLMSLFELYDEDLQEIGKLCEKVNALRDPKSFYCFVRFLVDEERTTTVSKELMARANDLAKQQVFASIRPSRVLKYLASLAFGNANNVAHVPRPSLLTTNAYASIGVCGAWVGKARARASPIRFASTYAKRKMERAFELQTDFTRVVCDEFEVVEIPFVAADKQRTPGSFIVFRPFYLGNLSYSNRRFSTEMMATVIRSLTTSQSTHGRLLLPQFHVESHNDLWKNVLRHGVQTDLGQSQKLPPLASLWHWTSLDVSADGLRQTPPPPPPPPTTKRTMPAKAGPAAGDECVQRRVPTDKLLSKSRPFAVRLDSPFTYMVMLNGLPVYTGSYFGSSPPKSKEIFIRAPERIRKKRYRPPKAKKRAQTRREKLFQKIRKSQDADRKRDEKRRKREEKRRLKEEQAKEKELAEQPPAGNDEQNPGEVVVHKKPGIFRRMMRRVLRR